jgi:hypothetical protein
MMHSAATKDTRHLPKPMPKGFVQLWLIFLVMAACFIRLHGASDYYYNPDEAMHTSIAGAGSLAQVLAFSHYEIHPPMLYILCHYWMMISADPAFVRGLSLLFGLLTIPLYYRIGKTLNGPLAGMCCAALIAFSPGCIIQSYVVRHYMILIFFVSLSFYFYLLWRDKHACGALLGYAFLGLLACLTHFSGIFDIFCIAAYETSGLVKRKAPRRVLAGWMLVNAGIGFVALYAYRLWQPILVPLKSYFATHTAGSLPNLLVHALFYPVATPGYVVGYTAALVLLMAQVWVAIAPPRFITNLARLRSLLTLSVLAYGLGMLLVVTRIYPEPGTRHSIWVLPFVILPTGWMLADGIYWLATKILPTRAVWPAAAVFLLACGLLAYSPQARFSDGSEYVWQKEVWDSFSDYMGTLGPADLIITEKDDGIMLANLYPYMGGDAFSGKVMARLAPYRGTRILFNPYFPRNYSTQVFLATLREAQASHLLDKADRLFFLRMAWSRSPLTDLMLCPAVDKRIITFPATPAGSTLSRDNINGSLAAIMVVVKEPFLRDVLSPEGKAHACLNGEHDKVPGLIPPRP